MPLARFDTWVRSTVGPAAAGTQVYICSQPAVTSAIPPSPLIQLYADSGAATTITQPLVADGFGHASAYLTAGSYTVVLVQFGRVQQVYPDQSVGGSGGGSSLTLQTNGVPNTLQSLLNIKGSGAVSVSSDGVGGVTVFSNGATVGGSNGQIQYNNTGAFAGDVKLIWDSNNKTLSIGNALTATANTSFNLQQTANDDNDFTSIRSRIVVANPSSGDGNTISTFLAEINDSGANGPDQINGFHLALQHNATEACSNVEGLTLDFGFQSTGPVDTVICGNAIINSTGAGSINQAIGYSSIINSNFDYGSPISIARGFISAFSTHGGDIADAIGFYATNSNLGRGSYTSLIGIRVDAPTMELSGTISSVEVTGNVLTIVGNNPGAFAQINDFITFYNVNTATFLNGQTVQITNTVSNTTIVANFTHADYGPAADTGNFTFSGVASSVYGIYVEDQSTATGPSNPNPYSIYVAGGKTHLAAIEDTTNNVGTAGQVLTSTVTGIQWANNGTSFVTANQGYFTGAQDFAPVLDDTGHNPDMGLSANAVVTVDLFLESNWTISSAALMCITGSGVGTAAVCTAIYSYDGLTKLWDAGGSPFDVHTASAVYRSVSFSPITLKAGSYKFAVGCTGTNGGSVLCHDSNIWFTDLVNGISGGSQVGPATSLATAANPIVTGAMPSTLGTLTPIQHGGAVNIPVILFRV